VKTRLKRPLGVFTRFEVAASVTLYDTSPSKGEGIPAKVRARSRRDGDTPTQNRGNEPREQKKERKKKLLCYARGVNALVDSACGQLTTKNISPAETRTSKFIRREWTMPANMLSRSGIAPAYTSVYSLNDHQICKTITLYTLKGHKISENHNNCT